MLLHNSWLMCSFRSLNNFAETKNKWEALETVMGITVCTNIIQNNTVSSSHPFVLCFMI
jgi:hypothetical protein